MSGPVLALPPSDRAAFIASIDDLDAMFDIVGFHTSLRVEADIAVTQRVNLLAAEALAVDVLEGADLAVAANLGIRYAVM